MTFDGALQATIKDINDSITDTLSSFSSRGVHGSLGVVKPDVAAPGDTIASAGMGTGTDTLVISGTSMATPLTAGVSALVRSAHPDYTPLMLKAVVMNQAGHDVCTGPNKTGHAYGPARVGAGRVDALSAVDTDTIAFSPGADNPVSASFGVVPARVDQGTLTKTLPLTVMNTSRRSTRYELSYDPVITQPGVSYSVSPSRLTVAGNSKGKATVTMRVQALGAAAHDRPDDGDQPARRAEAVRLRRLGPRAGHAVGRGRRTRSRLRRREAGLDDGRLGQRASGSRCPARASSRARQHRLDVVGLGAAARREVGHAAHLPAGQAGGCATTQERTGRRPAVRRRGQLG